MTDPALSDVRGIGPTAIETLSAEGITSVAELRDALEELAPGAGAIYSAHQLDVIEQLDLPTAGGQHLSQYTRQSDPETELTYVWEADTARYVLTVTRDGDRFRTRWTTTGEHADRQETFEDRADAVAALTRWAYRPPDVGLSQE